MTGVRLPNSAAPVPFPFVNSVPPGMIVTSTTPGRPGATSCAYARPDTAIPRTMTNTVNPLFMITSYVWRCKAEATHHLTLCRSAPGPNRVTRGGGWTHAGEPSRTPLPSMIRAPRYARKRAMVFPAVRRGRGQIAWVRMRFVALSTYAVFVLCSHSAAAQDLSRYRDVALRYYHRAA
jgi:hypothetical protein